MAMARRLAPFAERHHVTVAIHNQVDGNAAGAIDTPALKQALALSPAFTLKLDVGNLTASNCDAVAELHEHRSRVSLRASSGIDCGTAGASQPFGEGDTPINKVLSARGTSTSGVPALIEYDYVGLRSSVDELKASLAYCRDRGGRDSRGRITGMNRCSLVVFVSVVRRGCWLQRRRRSKHLPTKSTESTPSGPRRLRVGRTGRRGWSSSIPSPARS